MNQADVIVDLGHGFSGRVRPSEGERILWIHGYTINSSVWYHIWDLLPEWHHLGIDLLGHGGSKPMFPGLNLPMLGKTIGEIALKNGVRHIVGLSFGGMIALQVGIEYPTAFASLTLAAAALGGGPQDPAARIRYREMIMHYRQHGRGERLTELWMNWPPDIFKGAAKHPELWKELVDVVNSHPWYELDDLATRDLSAHKQRPEDLQKIRIPTLILVGDEEMAAFRVSADWIERDIPHCERVTLPETGHLCILEQPSLAAEKIVAHLRAHALTGFEQGDKVATL